ncbi:hypothetical protein [Verrucomicrobium sp. 3C]|uniref:hypothetical protein n=1 Tax=Verrucomicrobium sp. 3C TaxID=1134055 RepID=UPI0012DC0AA0|nr:hypothetical protein [Verrucomicrobium sp. 3C]
MAQHILSSASRMLGFSFITLGLIQGLWKTGSARSLMEDVVGFTILFFLGATVAAYLALRSGKASSFWERAADWLFLLGLACTAGETVVLVVSIT